MNALRWIKPLLLTTLITLSLSACGPSEEERLAEVVELTLTTAAVEAEAEKAATETPPVTFTGDLQPLGAAECSDLAAAMGQALNVQIEQIDVAVSREGKQGGGCQAIAVGSGLDFTDMMSVEEAVRGMLVAHGWAEDPTAAICLGVGGWGLGATASCFTKADALCEMFLHIDPVEASLCSEDEPINVCFERLTPEQIIYTTHLTCARDTNPAAKPLESELMRIAFDPGAIRASLQGEVPAGGFDHYVLRAMAGQEMTVNLLDPAGGTIAYNTAVLVIWGEDGTVLISDQADALSWVGPLLLTQDYYIDVKSVSAQPVAYTLEVIIPPASPSGAGPVFPQIEPFPFGEMQSIVLTGVPPMLPPEFVVESGLPEVAAYLLTTDEGEYELSLDYGVECQGAGACHYGSMAGMKVDTDVPVGTSSFPFVLEDTQVVELAYGITGYFIEAECGATCDDARMWWIYEGYEYMLGLKAGKVEDVTALANAAILNSVP
jgi:hypothetical protein